jgi:Helix-hairpin-helix motif
MARVVALCGAMLLGGMLMLGAHTSFAQTSKGATTTGDPAKAEKSDPKAPVDINTASESQLEELPGVGPATAKKIIAGRPYSSVKDLSKAGVSAKTMEKISPMVTVGAPSAPAAPSATPPPAASKSSATSKSAPAEARVPPAKGMVWVNTKSGVYHSEGDQWYGKTKDGKFMTEADAVKAGYRASKEGSATKKQ